MSLFLLPQPQFDTLLLPNRKVQNLPEKKNLPHEQTDFLKEYIENQIRKQKEIFTISRVQNIQTAQWHINVGAILQKYKTVLTFTLNKSKRSISMRIFFSTESGTLFRVHNKNKYAQISRIILFRNEKCNTKLINICSNTTNGQLHAQLPVCYLFSEYLEANNSIASCKIFNIFKDSFAQCFSTIEKIIRTTNIQLPFGLQQTQISKKIWENIYRYKEMMGISSHLNESYIQTQQQTTQNDTTKAIDIKRTVKNRQNLPNWMQANTFLFEQCIQYTNCLPQNENNFYLAYQQLQFIRSMIAMPIQPRCRHPYENNLIQNHILVYNANNITLKKINQGGFSQIFLTEIDYCYVFSSQGHEILYQDAAQRPSSVLHKYVIVKKETQFIESSRMDHQIKILKHIKNGLSIFLPKYYIVVNKKCVLSDSVVMDFIPFKTLRDYLKSNRDSMSLITKIYLILSITQSLRYIRDFRIVHLDLKPSNIMIFCNLLIKLIDFGESYHPQVCTQKHNPGFTIPYSPPEVYNFSDCKQFTSKSDVFSLGIIMHEILYSLRPFQIFQDTQKVDDSMKEYLNKCYFIPQEFQTFGDCQILRILNLIISKCLSPNPKDRPEFDWIALIMRLCLELCNI